MSKTTLVLIAGFIAGCGAAVVAPLIIPPAHAQTTQRWETLCVNKGLNHRDTDDGTNVALTEIGVQAGREGWELVSAVGHVGNPVRMTMCFKRPAP